MFFLDDELGFPPAEVMLSILLESFKFEPGSKEIFWATAMMSSPTIKGSNDISPQLPLKVNLLE